jgi:hypothetical protein
LDTAVTIVNSGQFVLKLQLKIRWRTTLPDAECILPRLMRLSGFSDDHARLCAPEVGIAVPSLQSFSIEDRFEARFFERLYWSLRAA